MNRSDILDTAKGYITGDREQSYGSPEDNFQNIANFWSNYLNYNISAKDVAVMMVLMKVARIKSGHSKEDNWIDICGYAACGGEIESAIHSILEAEGDL